MCRQHQEDGTRRDEMIREGKATAARTHEASDGDGPCFTAADPGRPWSPGMGTKYS